MARYIDADVIRENLIAFSEKYNYSNTAISYAIGYALNVIDNAPNADAEIIRCKDCKHYWKNWKNDKPDDECAVCLASPKDDAFCSEGERSE